MTAPTDSLRAQLLALLPELREAMAQRWTLKAVLAAHGQTPRLLDVLERVGAIEPAAAVQSHRWRRWRWTAEESDAALVERLLLLPFLYPKTLPARGVARWRLARKPKPCSRCEKTLDVTGPRPAYLLLRGKDRRRVHRPFYLCPRCVAPSEHPKHELRLAKLLFDLRPLEVLFPEDFLPWADRLADLGGDLLRVPAPGRSALHQLGRDLREVATWLRQADAKLAPVLHELRQEELREALGQADELLETVADHPANPTLTAAARAAAHAKLCEAYRARRVGEAARRLREIQTTATGWLLALRHRLHVRSLFQAPN